MVVHNCSPSTQEAEAVGMPRLHSNTLSQREAVGIFLFFVP
jgi:hypothetical protein